MNLRFLNLKGKWPDIGWLTLPGLLSAGIVAFLVQLGAEQPFEQLAYTLLFQLRGSQPWDARIAIIAIDEPSLEALGSFPLDRQYYARLFGILSEAQANIIVTSIILADSNPADVQLAEAMDQHGGIVLAQAWDTQGQVILPNPELLDAAVNIGHVLNVPGADGITRQVEAQIQGIPALGVAAVEAYTLIGGDAVVPSTHSSMWVNWPGPISQVPQYALSDVLARRISPAKFDNKIVVFGVAATGFDPLRTPYNRIPPANSVHLHAAVIDNLLNDSFLRVPESYWTGVLIVVGGPVLGIALAYRRQRPLWVIWLALSIAWAGITLIMFQSGHWLPVIWVLMLFALTAATTDIGERMKANLRLQRDIERLWRAYYPDLLAASAVGSYLADSGLIDSGSTCLGQHSNLEVAAFMPPHQSAYPIAMQRAWQLAQLADQFGRSQSAHAAIARSLSVGLLAADWGGRVWFCNPVAAELLTIQVGDRLDQHLIPTWIDELSWHQHLHTLQQSQPVSWEVSQGDRWFDLRLEPLIYSPPLGAASTGSAAPPDPTRPRGVLMLIEDITPYKQVEYEIRKALAQEQEFGELKSRFVSMVSHEIRTPLAILRTATELLERYGHLASEQKKQHYFLQIRTAIANMTQLLEDVLIVSKAEAGKLDLNLMPIQLVEFCQEIVHEFQTTLGVDHHIVFDALSQLPEINGDRNILRLVLVNLLSNAIKYSPLHSSIHLVLKQQGDRVIVQVRDEGIGIPLDDQQRIFEEFHRANNVGSTPGTGLGLAIVKHCVELHDGTILFTSEPGMGSVFTVTLPIG